MRVRLLAVVLLLGFSASGSELRNRLQDSSSNLGALTNLGKIGNQQLAAAFTKYNETHAGCVSTSNDSSPRLLITGFGLFQGAAFNPSGAVVDAIAGSTESFGKLTGSDHGARVYNLELFLGAQKVQACLLVLDVKWDFAGAVIASEMERFQPDAVVMTGRGTYNAIVEYGAINLAMPMSGFNPDGSPDRENTPIAPKILEDEPEGEIAMTWNQGAVAAKVLPLILELGATLQIPPGARSNNDYICNNVSYLALQAAAGKTLSLGNGSLVLAPQIASNPKVGFMHLPMTIPQERQAVEAWSKVVLAAATAVLE